MTSSSLTDSHCHLQDPAFVADLSEVLERAERFGIHRFVVNGTSPQDWPVVARLAGQYPDQVLPQFGVHPWQVENLPKDWEEQLKAMLLRFPKAGIGEIGLDSQLTDAPMGIQQAVFQRQLELSVEFDRPCTLHIVKAWNELMPLLKEITPPRFLLHSYGGSAEQVDGFVKAGAYFSFGGAVIRHGNSKKLKTALCAVPSDRILLETDAPFQHPEGRGQRQEPAGYLKIAETVAQIRRESLDTLLCHCEENLQQLFIPPSENLEAV